MVDNRDLKIGDRVRLTLEVRKSMNIRGRRETSHVKQFYDDVEGGVELERPLVGFRSWNVKDLELVEEEVR